MARLKTAAIVEGTCRMDEHRTELWAFFITAALIGCSSSSDTGGLTGHHGSNDDAGANGARAGSGASKGSGASGNDDMGGVGGAGASGGNGAAQGSSGMKGTAGSVGKIPIGTTQCSDGKDNDGDGLVDSRDPECTGPLDND